MSWEKRRKTRKIRVGPYILGSGEPVRIQSMNTTDSRDVEACLRQIHQLAAAGCEITRLAIPDLEAADALKKITQKSPLPIVADIHFDYRLALESLKNGAAKIRINPGNIGDPDRVRAVAKQAKERGIPIRVGVNAGSLEKEILVREGGVTAKALARSAQKAAEQVEAAGCEEIVLSLKASSPKLTIDAYRLLAPRVDYPFHIGVTEAGTLREGVIRSAVGIGTLLAEGIGETLRVSLTADPVEEVRAAWSIVKSLDLRERGPIFISCPTCGRTQVNLNRVATEVEERLKDIKKPLRIAVMGCAVNGPGEAREADFGIAGGRGKFLLFRKGEILCQLPEEEAVDAFVTMIKKEAEKGGSELD